MAKPKKQIRVIYKRVGFDPVEVTVPNDLEHLQMMVGGDIETVRWPAAQKVVMLVDDEGKIKNRPINFPYRGDLICGSVLWVGVKGEEFDDCPYDLEAFQRRWPYFFEEEDEVDE